MLLDKLLKSEKEITEECLPSHMLATCLSNIPKDIDDKRGNHVNTKMIEMLNNASAVPLKGQPTDKMIKAAKRVVSLTNDVLRYANSVETYKELSLASALLISRIASEKRIFDVGGQGCLISAIIVDEALETGEWGNIKLAKKAADSMYDHLIRNNYYEEKTCH